MFTKDLFYSVLIAAAVICVKPSVAAEQTQSQDHDRDQAQMHDQMQMQDRDHQPIVGWQLMTPEERQAFQQKMRSMDSAQERQAYREEHREMMQERARAQGIDLEHMPATAAGKQSGKQGQGMGQGMGHNNGMGQGGGMGSGGQGKNQ
ncbi:hypothetical protein QQM79_15915 [Marinobacteraceae bacterium S3BR75-40.1]